MKRLVGYIIVLSAAVWGQNASPTINQLPTRQFGHPVTENLNGNPAQASPNLVEGRELNLPGQIAFDNSVSPPILYIADISNNRVLAYKNPAGVGPGKIADLVIGQQDLVSTMAQGPTTALSTGLSSPTGVAVDRSGNLYVADAGNNRIMRFPAPFGQQPGAPPQPDLVIGQQSFGSGSTANQGGSCSSKTVAFTNFQGVQLTSLAIDSTGNLWTTDPLNNRVLMYAVANLAAHSVAPVASVVLGQNDFATCSQGQTTSGSPQLNKAIVIDPSGLTFDAAGNLYVADIYARVLFYQGPNFASQGQTAARVLGVSPPVAQGQAATVYPTQYTLGFINASGQATPANGVFTNGTNLFVADTPSHRIVEYDIPSKWAAESTPFPSPAILHVYGQVGFATGKANGGGAQPSSFTFASPYGGAFLGNQMWVADSGNNRVLGISPDATANYSAASVLIGQLDYIYSAPNLIVGSEVYLNSTLGPASGMVVDNSSNPPHLYVSDPGNNRILCFKNGLIVGQGPTLPVADMVIGQPDFKTSEINFPGGLAGQPTQMGLYSPIGVAVDSSGNLYVADSANGRVVRFPAPFNQAGCPAACAAQPTANLVLGQSDFNSFIQNASANSMHTSWGVAIFADSASQNPLTGSIAVSDPVFNRVLIFKRQASGDFVSGQTASLVLGQSSFSGTSTGTAANFSAFNSPRGIASDTSDRLYVADTVNNRVMVFSGVPEGSSGATSTAQITSGLNQPQAVAVNATTTELWVANTNQSVVYRYPQYTVCQLSCTPTAQLASYAPLGLALDGSGNVIVGDLSHRITFYFAQAFYKNAATYSAQQPLAPGMLVVLGRAGQSFSVPDAPNQPAPWPKTLSGVNITVNGTPAPVFATNGAFGAIYFQVPSNAPTSGSANFIVTNTGGAVLGVGQFQMGKSDPGFFSTNASGVGPVAATNDDGTINSPANGVSRSGTHVITFYLTGQGVVSGAPPDGQGAAAATNTPILPVVFMNGTQLPPSAIQYSGLAPGEPGVWQLNVVVPSTVPPAAAISITLSMNDIFANIGGNTQNFADGTPGPDLRPIQTTFSTKP